ncbi:hypothetical protein CXB51_036088 [Gossypium anomalum]|uniref:DUF7745 domain-containing protein n=1 Tax=Gossypium anomalum TaxID=47600 RepID=A0A8J6CE90_9ROSI|nr:hypothetical protein CXB51_036088 [Gossypium anomalum]
MEESIKQVTEKNTVIRDWSLKTQKAKGDSLTEGCISNLPEGIFTEKYGDIAHFITVNEDMTPTIEEYAALLRIDNVQFSKIYVKEPKPMTFKKKSYGFFERLKQGINHVLTILAETFRSLNCCRRKREGLFIGCAQLLNVRILSHFWKVERTPFHMFSKTFAPLKAYLEKDWPKDVTEQHWVLVFQNLSTEDITWRAPWIRPSVLLYKSGSQDWVPLLGLWGGVGYAPLMVQRQFASRQFLPATGGLAQSEFAFTGEGPRYCKILEGNSPNGNPFSEEMPSELEIARHEFECEKAKLLRDINSLQEENYQLKIDVQIEKSKTGKAQREAEINGRKKLAISKVGGNSGKGKQRKNRKKLDTRTYERALQEKEMQLGFLINEIRKADMQVVQLSDEAEALSCQFPPSQRSSISEFLERVKKQGNVARNFV